MAAGTSLRQSSIRGRRFIRRSCAPGVVGSPVCGSRPIGLSASLRLPVYSWIAVVLSEAPVPLPGLLPLSLLSPCSPPPGCQPPFRGLIAPFGYLPKVRKSNDLTRFFQSFVREMRFSSRALLSVDRTARGELFDVEGSVGFRLRRLRCEARCGAESSVGCEPFGVAAARDNACSGRFFGDCPAGEAPCPRDFFGVCNEVADS